MQILCHIPLRLALRQLLYNLPSHPKLFILARRENILEKCLEQTYVTRSPPNHPKKILGIFLRLFFPFFSPCSHRTSTLSPPNNDVNPSTTLGASRQKVKTRT